MASRVQIANMALALLGDEPVADLDASNGASKAERLAASFLDIALDENLAIQPWQEATRRAALAAAATAPLFNWDAQYPLPANCVRLNLVCTEDAWVQEGRAILTNSGAPLNIIYNDRIDVAALGPYLAAATAARLAWRMAMAIKESRAALDRIHTAWREALQLAAMVNAEQSGGGHTLRSKLVAASYGAVYGAGGNPDDNTRRGGY